MLRKKRTGVNLLHGWPLGIFTELFVTISCYTFFYSFLVGKHKNSRVKTLPTHPLLIHKLLYTQHYDTQQCLYTLRRIILILKSEGRSFICAAATTSMNMCNTPHQAILRQLLIRHRRVLSGNDFYGSLAEGIYVFFCRMGFKIS